MGPIARLLLFLLRLCPSVTVNLQTGRETTSATTATASNPASAYGPESCPDFIEDDEEPLDWPSQEALENHMTLAYLEHCYNLQPSTNDD